MAFHTVLLKWELLTLEAPKLQVLDNERDGALSLIWPCLSPSLQELKPSYQPFWVPSYPLPISPSTTSPSFPTSLLLSNVNSPGPGTQGKAHPPPPHFCCWMARVTPGLGNRARELVRISLEATLGLTWFFFLVFLKKNISCTMRISFLPKYLIKLT